MGEPSKSQTELPPVLEQLGALGSLLVHDMANQMCIISGNATFAQMMLEEPQQLPRAIDAIAKAAERVSYILGQCAEVRRRLGGEVPHGDATEAFAQVKALFAERPGWVLEEGSGIAGRLQLPTPWFVFAVDQILRAASAKDGRARMRRASPDSDTTFLPGGTYLEVRLWWNSTRRFSLEDTRNRFEDFGLLAAFELVRQCGGKLEGFTPAEGRQEAIFCAPYVLDPGAGR